MAGVPLSYYYHHHYHLLLNLAGRHFDRLSENCVEDLMACEKVECDFGLSSGFVLLSTVQTGPISG